MLLDSAIFTKCAFEKNNLEKNMQNIKCLHTVYLYKKNGTEMLIILKSLLVGFFFDPNLDDNSAYPDYVYEMLQRDSSGATHTDINS